MVSRAFVAKRAYDSLLLIRIGNDSDREHHRGRRTATKTFYRRKCESRLVQPK
jgi:hypothetical protein